MRDEEMPADDIKSKIEDAIIIAIEGGSNYWYMIEKGRWNAGAHIWDGTLTVSNRKLVDGEGDELKQVVLNEQTIAKGFTIFKQKYSRHYQDLMDENDDAETGDVLLQCIVLGEVCYG